MKICHDPDIRKKAVQSTFPNVNDPEGRSAAPDVRTVEIDDKMYAVYLGETYCDQYGCVDFPLEVFEL